MKKKLKIKVNIEHIAIYGKRGFLGIRGKSQEYQDFWENDGILMRVFDVLEGKKKAPQNIQEVRDAITISRANIKESVTNKNNWAAIADVGNILDQIYEFYL
jgi:hypothetical protein